MLIVADLANDTRFDHATMVVADPRCRFYCGMPLITDESYALGTLCVWDYEPRRLDLEQMEALRRLSRQVLTLLGPRRRPIEHSRLIRKLELAHNEVATQQQRAQELLSNLLPRDVAEELATHGRVRSRHR
jgi:adenylate cyclase